MADKLYYFTLGVVIMGIISMFVVRYIPTPRTPDSCMVCNDCWWFELAEGDE